MILAVLVGFLLRLTANPDCGHIGFANMVTPLDARLGSRQKSIEYGMVDIWPRGYKAFFKRKCKGFLFSGGYKTVFPLPLHFPLHFPLSPYTCKGNPKGSLRILREVRSSLQDKRNM
jgi:hypothetical protein